MSLEELLARSRVWRGSAHGQAASTIPTGHPALDRFLPGAGWPCDAVTEIACGRPGSGELSLVMPALAALSRGACPGGGPSGGNPRHAALRDEPRWIVWIAPPFVPYAPALVQHGLNLERVLLVHPRGRRDALWAAEQAIHSGSSAAILVWLGAASGTALRRLQLAAGERACLTMLFRPLEALRTRTPAALRLRLAQTLFGTRVEVLKCRGRHPGVVDVDLAPSDAAPTRRGSGQHGSEKLECR